MPYVEGECLRERLTREARFRRPRRCGSSRMCSMRWPTRTARASSIATSSPRTSCSPGGTPWWWTSARQGGHRRGGPARSPADPHHHRPRHRHAGVHGAGAGRRADVDRRAGGSLRRGRDGLRNAQRPAPVHRSDAAGDARGAGDPDSGTARSRGPDSRRRSRQPSCAAWRRIPATAGSPPRRCSRRWKRSPRRRAVSPARRRHGPAAAPALGDVRGRDRRRCRTGGLVLVRSGRHQRRTTLGARSGDPGSSRSRSGANGTPRTRLPARSRRSTPTTRSSGRSGPGLRGA